MQYFKVNKYSSLDENPLFIAKKVYELILEKDKSLNDIIDEYSKKYEVNIGVNMESSLYLAITFLFATDRLVMKKDKFSVLRQEG